VVNVFFRKWVFVCDSWSFGINDPGFMQAVRVMLEEFLKA
jgi:hypothetical protein